MLHMAPALYSVACMDVLCVELFDALSCLCVSPVVLSCVVLCKLDEHSSLLVFVNESVSCRTLQD
jgi:hypothetical protein